MTLEKAKELAKLNKDFYIALQYKNRWSIWNQVQPFYYPYNRFDSPIGEKTISILKKSNNFEVLDFRKINHCQIVDLNQLPRIEEN